MGKEYLYTRASKAVNIKREGEFLSILHTLFSTIQRLGASKALVRIRPQLALVSQLFYPTIELVKK